MNCGEASRIRRSFISSVILRSMMGPLEFWVCVTVSSILGDAVRTLLSAPSTGAARAGSGGMFGINGTKLDTGLGLSLSVNRTYHWLPLQRASEYSMIQVQKVLQIARYDTLGHWWWVQAWMIQVGFPGLAWESAHSHACSIIYFYFKNKLSMIKKDNSLV